MKQRFYSNGKLLLTGEYAVLDGALSLAVPTKYGQALEVEQNTSGILKWKSLEHNDDIWFETEFDLKYLSHTNDQTSETRNSLKEILIAAKHLNPYFLDNTVGYSVETKLDFPREWGLGSSSTLINNIANWAKVDPYVLLKQTFGGSGYDIACARHKLPLLYQLIKDKPQITAINFDPSFAAHLYFVYLNRKQNSREGINEYRKRHLAKQVLVDQISEITNQIISCTDLAQFEQLLVLHETLLSKALGVPTVRESLFPNYAGVVKSLGAWGGDFILATGNKKTPDYFKSRGYKIVIPYLSMVLNQ